MMNEFESQPVVAAEGEKEKEQRELLDEARGHLEALFSISDPEARLQRMREQLAPYIKTGHLDASVQEELVRCSQMTDEKEFIQTMLRVVDPILQLRLHSRGEYDQVLREHWDNEHQYIPINELFSYEFDAGGRVRLHVPENRDRNVGELRGLMRDGLHKLAVIVKTHNEQHPEAQIPRVVAASWIIARIPSVLKQAGFTVHGEIDPALRDAHFQDDDRPIHFAEISTEELLKRYG